MKKSEDQHQPSKPWKVRVVFLLAVFVFDCATLSAGESVRPEELAVVCDNALEYLRSQQDETGGFGAKQPRLQTAASILALLCAAATPTAADRACIEKAVAFLLQAGSRSGDLGDDAFRTESHSLSLVALLCATPYLRDDALRQKVAETVSRALRLLQRWQDRSSSSVSRGGWKMEGREGKTNDRRATAWALLSYRTAELYGLAVKTANRDRALDFLLGSFKHTADNPEQVGGLSVDAEGLAVASISAMGGWQLQYWRATGKEAKLNAQWLVRHLPVWSGPNYFYTNFFHLRTLRRADPGAREFSRALRAVFLQIREHQGKDGAIGFPPGNAQNTVAMGPVFSTALSVLILNVQNSRLVFDEDYRVPSLF